MFLAAEGCLVAPFTLGPEVFGVLLGLGEAGTLRGAGPIETTGGMSERREREGVVGGDAGWWLSGLKD